MYSKVETCGVSIASFISQHESYAKQFPRVTADDIENKPLRSMENTMELRVKALQVALAVNEGDATRLRAAIADGAAKLLNLTSISVVPTIVSQNMLLAAMDFDNGTGNEAYQASFDRIDANINILDFLMATGKQGLTLLKSLQEKRQVRLAASKAAASTPPKVTMAKEQAKAANANVAKAAASAKAPALGGTIFDRAFGKTMQSVKVENVGGTDGLTPYMIENLHFDFLNSPTLTAWMTQFVIDFPDSKAFKLRGKCQLQSQQMKADVVAGVRPHLFDSAPWADVSKKLEDSDNMTSVYRSLSAYGMNVSMAPSCNVEYEVGGQLRFELGGGVSLFTASFASVQEEMVKKNPDKQVSEEDLRKFLLHLSNEDLAAMAGAGKVYKFDRRCGDVTYTPAGWFVAESPLGKSNPWGFRQSVIGSGNLPELTRFNSVFPKLTLTSLLRKFKQEP